MIDVGLLGDASRVDKTDLGLERSLRKHGPLLTCIGPVQSCAGVHL